MKATPTPRHRAAAGAGAGRRAGARGRGRSLPRSSATVRDLPRSTSASAGRRQHSDPALLPFSLLREGNLNLDEFTWERGRSAAACRTTCTTTAAHIYSVTTIATALVVTPLYVLPAWWLSHRRARLRRRAARACSAWRWSASPRRCITALSASGCSSHRLRRLTTRRWAHRADARSTRLGTSTWSISSQALVGRTAWPSSVWPSCAHPARAGALDGRAGSAPGSPPAVMIANRPQTVDLRRPSAFLVRRRAHRRARRSRFAALSALLGVAAADRLQPRRSSARARRATAASTRFDGSILVGACRIADQPQPRPARLHADHGVRACGRGAGVARARAAVAALAERRRSRCTCSCTRALQEWWAGYTYGPRYFTDRACRR